jgi:hypothetical protein
MPDKEKGLSEKERERVAHTHEKYLQHIKGLNQAHHDYISNMGYEEGLKAQYETIKSILLKRFGG